MAKSRIAPGLLAALISAPAAAQPATIEQLIERQRADVETALRPACDRAGDEEEIVVCGTREDDSRYRVPLLVPPGASPGRSAGGEQRAALAIDTSPCTTVGRDQRCNAGLDVIGIGFMIARAVAQALANRD